MRAHNGSFADPRFRTPIPKLAFFVVVVVVRRGVLVARRILFTAEALHSPIDPWMENWI